MATKKQNRTTAKRRARRVLNAAVDFFNKVSGKKLNKLKYGANLGRSSIREHLSEG